MSNCIPSQELQMLYFSPNKIAAFEDTITFFPSLFRLTKSIIMTEPLPDLGSLISSNNYSHSRSNFVSSFQDSLNERKEDDFEDSRFVRRATGLSD